MTEDKKQDPLDEIEEIEEQEVEGDLTLDDLPL